MTGQHFAATNATKTTPSRFPAKPGRSWLTAALLALTVGCDNAAGPQASTPANNTTPGGSETADAGKNARTANTADEQGTGDKAGATNIAGNNAGGSGGGDRMTGNNTDTQANSGQTDKGQTDSGQANQDQQATNQGGAQEDPPVIDWDKAIPQPPEAQGMTLARPDAEIWFDTDSKKIVLAGRICQNIGPLEFFGTLRGYQEHEAIATFKTRSSYVHALFLALGIEPGHPVQFRPEFRAAAGPEIEVTVYWTDEKGERRSVPAQEWIRNAQTGEQLKHPFIFGGSTFYQMEDGKEFYAADDGYLICVSNFPSAMLDLPISSTDSNANLMFEAFEGRVPAVGTEIAVVLQPKSAAKDGDAAKNADGQQKDDKQADGQQSSGN